MSENLLLGRFHLETLSLPSTTHHLHSEDPLSAPRPGVLIQLYLKSKTGGWDRRYSRLIQWLVLFDVVHPGQHCPPQTFLLWSHQSKVNTRMLRAGTLHTTPFRQDLGE